MTRTNLKEGDIKKIGKLFIYCGLIIVLVTTFLSINKFINLASNFISTQAKIIDIQSYIAVRATKPTTVYVTTIEFFVDKNEFIPLGYTSVSQQKFHENKQGEIGENIPIWYEAKDPTNVNINRFHYLWGFSEFFAILGFVSMFLGVWIYRKEKN